MQNRGSDRSRPLLSELDSCRCADIVQKKESCPVGSPVGLSSQSHLSGPFRYGYLGGGGLYFFPQILRGAERTIGPVSERMGESRDQCEDVIRDVVIQDKAHGRVCETWGVDMEAGHRSPGFGIVGSRPS